MPEAEPRRDERSRRSSYRTLRRLGAAQGGGLFVALFGLGTYFTIASRAFLTRSNLLVVLLQVSMLGMVAVPGSMLLLAGKIDLSVGSVCRPRGGMLRPVRQDYRVGRSAFQSPGRSLSAPCGG